MAFSPTGRMMESRGLYRAWLSKYFSTVSLAGLASDDEPILLRKIYVPLVLTKERVADHETEQAIHRGGAFLPKWLSSRKEVEEERVFLITGEAGSGKTTLVSAVVDSFAGEVGDDLNRRFRGYVPFPIFLREAPLEQLDSLSDLIDWWLQQAKAENPGLEIQALREFLDGGQGILLLDGLDEVGTLARRTRVMGWLRDHPWACRQRVSLVRQLIFRDTPTNLVIVTARPSGFEGLRAEDLPPAHSLFVAPFSHEQIRTYLTRWFELRPLRSEQRQNTVENLVNRLTSSQQAGRLLPLSRRPAYLASLAFVHGTRGELPYTRAALYEQLVEAYIEMLDRQRGVLDRAEQAGELPVWDRQEKIEVLSAVAFQAHVGATARQKGQQPTEHQEKDRRFLWRRDELESAVRAAVEDGADRFRTIRAEHVSQLTAYFVARTGLLVETREGQYQFGHLSFQEYLTALFVLNRAAAGSDKAAELERILFLRLGEPGWLEVGVLVLAIDANRSGGKGHEPVLARLDLNQPDHLVFLAQLLSGEEIRFTAEERRAWILVWLTFWATRRINSAALESTLGFPANRETLAEAWRSVCGNLEKRGSGLDGLVSLVERTLEAIERPARPGHRSLDALVASSKGGSSEPETSAAREAWSRFPQIEDADLPAARLLVMPLLGAFIQWEEAEAALVALPGRVDLFLRPEPGQLQPTRIQYGLDSWSLGSDALLRNLAEQTPLLWWIQDEFFALRVSSVESGSAPLILWRGALRTRLLRIEQSWWTSQLISDERLQKTLAMAQDQALARDQALDRDEYLLDLDLDLLQARARARTRAWAQDRARDRALNLAKARSQALDRALNLARARNLDLGLGRNRAQDLDQALALDRSLALDRLVSVLGSRIKSLERNRSLRNHALDLFQAAILSISTGWLVGPSPPVRRSNLTSSLGAFRNSESVTAPLQGTPFAEQALQEWEDVLASPFSPIPHLEETLHGEWEELPTDAEGTAQLFDNALAKLEKRL